MKILGAPKIGTKYMMILKNIIHNDAIKDGAKEAFKKLFGRGDSGRDWGSPFASGL